MSGLIPILQALHDSPFATAIREGGWWFPLIETLHVVAITSVVGSIAIVDLRLLGVPGHDASAARMMRDLLPLTLTAFVIAVISGSLMFITNAVQYAQNPQFRWKMLLIAAAGLNMAVFHSGAGRAIESWDAQRWPPARARLAGAVSLLLWLGIIFLGRWVGFVVTSSAAGGLAPP